MHICSAYTNRIDDHENHICCITRCMRRSWLVNQVERQGLETATPLNCGMHARHEYNHTCSHNCMGLLAKKKEKKKLILTDICPHSLAVSHCIKKKKSYIKAALKQTSGAMTLKGGRQSFE